MIKIIISIVLTCGLGIWTGYAGLKTIARVSPRYQLICYVVPAIAIVGLIKFVILIF